MVRRVDSRRDHWSRSRTHAARRNRGSARSRQPRATRVPPVGRNSPSKPPRAPR